MTKLTQVRLVNCLFVMGPVPSVLVEVLLKRQLSLFYTLSLRRRVSRLSWSHGSVQILNNSGFLRRLTWWFCLDYPNVLRFCTEKLTFLLLFIKKVLSFYRK